MFDHFELLLFSVNEEQVRRAANAGVDGFIVDWEAAGKHRRQAGADTEINCHTAEDLEIIRKATNRNVICRVNNVPEKLELDIERAILLGADEVLVPMIRAANEVQRIIDFVDNRCRVGILIETTEAVQDSIQFSNLLLSRIYLGLNDLAIDRGSPSIFCALVDGTLEHVCKSVTQPFGFAGLTLPDKGDPVPCRLLMSEMVRLKCNFSFLRRSFHRDIADCNDWAKEISRIRECYCLLNERTDREVADDHAALIKIATSLAADQTLPATPS